MGVGVKVAANWLMASRFAGWSPVMCNSKQTPVRSGARELWPGMEACRGSQDAGQTEETRSVCPCQGG